MKGKTMKIKIDELDLSLQTRAGTDAETIDTYADAMADGSQFPDVTVFTDGNRYWLADGFHRVMAAKQNGCTTIAADVRKGTEDDAVVFGGTANNKQGKRPTRADVRHFLEMVWERREAIFGGTPTGGNLAEKCGVSNRTGRLFVEEQLAKMPPAPVRPTRQNAHLPEANSRGQIAHVKMPVRPTQLVGADGKMYPVRPVAPKAPVRPSAPFAPPTRPERPAHVVPLDRFGTEIPVELQPAFDGNPLAEILAHISKARVALKDGVASGNAAFAAVRQDAILQLDNAYNFVKSAVPFCVCRMCQGDGCKACHDKGFQTEEQYDRNPKEFKAKGGEA